MIRTLLPRSLQLFAVSVLLSASSVLSLAAEPITVTSGIFGSPDDGPAGFGLFGPDGFALGAFNPLVTSSPGGTCFEGCTPGSAVDMSTAAGGESTFTRFTLGLPGEANINGIRFTQLGLAGTFRFDAPAVVLPPLDSFKPLTAPFVFHGHVTGFARDDLNLQVPLFDGALIGQGSAMLNFFGFVDGSYRRPYVTYTFATPALGPVPEPTTIVLLGTAFAGIAARRWRQRNRLSRSIDFAYPQRTSACPYCPTSRPT
jgi:hypothetical protein